MKRKCKKRIFLGEPSLDIVFVLIAFFILEIPVMILDVPSWVYFVLMGQMMIYAVGLIVDRYKYSIVFRADTEEELEKAINEYFAENTENEENTET